MASIKYILTFLFLGLFPFICEAKITAEPTFTSCSIYVPSESKGTCTVWYRKTSDKKWNPVLTPFYDALNKEFRVSMVRLAENTPYEVKIDLKAAGSNSVNSQITSFKTWTSTPTISKTIKLSTFLTAGSKVVELKSIKGTSAGWIKIVGDVPITAGEEKDYAIQIENCQYIILENLNVKGGYKHGIIVNSTCSDVRIINSNISHWGRVPQTQAKNGFYLDKDGKEINNDAGIKVERAKNIVVERCYIHDPNGFTNTWDGEVALGEFKGEKFKFTHPQGPNAVYFRQSGGGTVLRYNDFVGSQTHRYNDPVETSRNGDADGGFNKDADIYGNVMAFGQDDGIELDGGQCNVRMFDNRIEQVFCGISTAPNKKGPSYIFNNLVWNLGNGAGEMSVSVKNGGGPEHSLGMQYFFNNTMISIKNGITGIGFGCNEPECKRQLFHGFSRNNILLASNLPTGSDATPRAGSMAISDKHLDSLSSYDYDMIGNRTLPDGKGKFIAAAGNETHAIYAVPAFTDAQHGIFTLAASDKGINNGLFIPNFNQSFTGPAPDMGAFESGSSSLSPNRPINITADKYFVQLEPGKPETLTLTIGKITRNHTFTVQKNEDMDWLTIDKTAGNISSDSKLVVKLTAKSTTAAVQKGMIFIRLENGYSVPVTVFGK